jgi:hypothetical protein
MFRLCVGGILLKKRNWLIFTIVIVVISVLVAFWINNTLPVAQDFPATNVAIVNPHYLPFVKVDWRDINETRIFLSSAIPRYGYFKNQTSDSQIQKGDPCFIINVTARNDYSELSPPPSPRGNDNYNFSRYGYYVYFEVRLFDKDGVVNFEKLVISQVPGSLPGSNVAVDFIRIDSGETKSFDIYLKTANREIDQFELYVYEISGQLLFT